MDWLTFTLASLTTFRLALMLTQEDGPAWIFRKLRNAPPKRSSARKGIRCMWCSSVWMSWPVTTFLWWIGSVPFQWTFLYSLAISGAAIIINQWAIAYFK